MGAARRLLRGKLAPLVLIVAATLALPGRFLDDPVLLDSYALRVKARALSTLELFERDQSEVVSPYYRPLFTVLHAATDRLTGGTHAGLRVLALLAHAFAAAGLVRYGRAIGLRRTAVLGGLLLFLVAPPNVATAAWPVVAYWTLAAGLCFFAAADLVGFVASGRRWLAARALALVAVSLASSETGYHFVALLPLLALAPPRAGSRRARALRLAPLFAALALGHFLFLESASSQGLVSAPLERAGIAATAWRQYLESPLGGDPLGGARPMAWVALALILVGIGRSRPRRYVALHALAAPLPFVLIGHNDRCAYFAAGLLALAFAACAPRGLLRLLGLLRRRRGAAPRSARRALAGATAGLVVMLAGAQLVQMRPRFEALDLAGRETAVLLAALAPHHDGLADPARIAFVNVPATLKWAIWDAAHIVQPRDFQALVMPSVLCTARGYFAAAPLDLSGQVTRVLELDGDRLHEREPSRPLGAREPLPWLFLAAGVETLPPPPPSAGRLARQRHLDAILARTRALDDPLAHVLVEQPLPQLVAPLPTRDLSWKVEPIVTPPGVAPRPGLAGQQLVADVDLERTGFLVAVTYLAVEDPLRRVTGDSARFADLLEATLDGVRVPIVPAFAHGCGVVVPRGMHRIVLRMKSAAGNAFADGGGG